MPSAVIASAGMPTTATKSTIGEKPNRRGEERVSRMVGGCYSTARPMTGRPNPSWGHEPADLDEKLYERGAASGSAP
jgi:hypothetical protein